MVTIEHIDTCFGCYLTDHHNRDGETLLGVPVDGTTTYREVKSQLRGEALDARMYRELPNYVTDAAIRAAVESLLPEGDNLDELILPDASEVGEAPDEDADEYAESPSAWFVMTWEVQPYIRWDIYDPAGDLVHNCIVNQYERENYLSDYLADGYRWVDNGEVEAESVGRMSLTYRGLAHREVE